MEPKDALVLFFERSNAIQTFWNFYITVVLGVLAFFGYAPRTKSTAIMLLVAFLLFAYVNFKGMTAIARERIEVCQEEAKKNWDAMRVDPEFQEIVKSEQAEKTLERAEVTFMRPTDFSPLK